MKIINGAQYYTAKEVMAEVTKRRLRSDDERTRNLGAMERSGIWYWYTSRADKHEDFNLVNPDKPAKAVLRRSYYRQHGADLYSEKVINAAMESLVTSPYRNVKGKKR